MEELIFFAVIIFFSILESIARSRRAKRRGETEEDESTRPREREWEARLPDMEPPRPEPGGERGERLSTYDDDPSYDEMATRDRRRPSSETMLPGDLLEQLEGLARGRTSQRAETGAESPSEEARRRRELRRRREEVERQREEARRRQEEASRRLEEARRQQVEARRRRAEPGGEPGRALPQRRGAPLPPLERSEVGSRETWSRSVGSTTPVGSRDPIGGDVVEHEIHRSHRDYGTDPSSRPPSAQDAPGPLAAKLDEQAAAVRRRLLRGGRPALREAMVLKEVLGPPVSMRDDHLGGE
ncbi:MAG: hypothetical protein R3304_07825 [Longimicrobiales bacterium]|nr:hypothetical protein [Longimicrobiales bacterium]